MFDFFSRFPNGARAAAGLLTQGWTVRSWHVAVVLCVLFYAVWRWLFA